MGQFVYDVFFSYAHADKEIACALYDYLTEHGIRCFIDIDNIYPGDRYQEIEIEYINKSQKVLFLFSNNCYDGEKVRKEIDVELDCALKFSDKDNNRIIPFYLGIPDIKDSIQPYIKGISAFNMTGDAPSSLFEVFLKKLLSVIEPINFLGDPENDSFVMLMGKANEGDVESQIRMANYYLQPRQPKIEYERAIDWYRKAENNGSLAARFHMGQCYLNLIKDYLYQLNTLFDGEISVQSLNIIKHIHYYWKESEKWYRESAESSEYLALACSGLLELLSYTLWLSWGNNWLPDDETMVLLEKISPSNSSLGTQEKYRFCYVMYNLLDFSHSESEKPRHNLISTLAETTLLSWAKQGETDALLFLGAASYRGFWNHITVYDEGETIIHDAEIEKNVLDLNKSVDYLNRAYQIKGDELLRYNLSDYFPETSYKEYLWDKLLTQDSFNPLGIQLFLSYNPGQLETWENCFTIVDELRLSTPEKYYYLGYGAVHTNLSFAAVWLSCAIGNIKAKELLADYFFESLLLYKKGCQTWVGYVDNMKSHMNHGGNSGDMFLDEEARHIKISGGHIEDIDSSRFVASYMRNLPKAVILYRDAVNQYKLGRCYYWGLGVPKDENEAARLGYSATNASSEEGQWVAYLSHLVQEYNRKREEEEYLKTLEEQAPDYGESINSFLLKKKEKGKEREAEWRVHFPEIPCPLEYMS